MVASIPWSRPDPSPGEDGGGRLTDLLWPGALPTLVRTRRAELLSVRVRWAALAAAVVTPLWIAADAALLPLSQWGPVAGGRGAASLGFLALALALRRNPSVRRAQAGLAALFGIPTLFYFFVSGVLPDAAPSGAAGALVASYKLLPFIVVCAVALFPLTAAEAAAVALPVVAGKMLGLFAAPGAMWVTQLASAWFLLVLWAIAAAGALGQLHFMLALFHRASRDVLTSALTRAVGDELLALHWHHARRGNQPLAVVFVDLDGFKSVNDRFGHEAGDAVLRETATTLRSMTRGGDALVRWGGDEFVILLPGATAEAAQTVARRIARTGLAGRPDGTTQYASYGLAERQADELEDWPELIRIADQRAYAAKARAVSPGG